MSRTPIVIIDLDKLDAFDFLNVINGILVVDNISNLIYKPEEVEFYPYDLNGGNFCVFDGVSLANKNGSERAMVPAVKTSGCQIKNGIVKFLHDVYNNQSKCTCFKLTGSMNIMCNKNTINGLFEKIDNVDFFLRIFLTEQFEDGQVLYFKEDPEFTGVVPYLKQEDAITRFGCMVVENSMQSVFI